MDPRPRITLSYAQSLDGRIATRTGDSQWISGEKTLQLAHQLRNDNDAILVGVGTVLADNPRLTCRLTEGRNPHRVVLDSRLRTPMDSYIVRQATEVTTTICCTNGVPPERRAPFEAAGVRVAILPGNDERLELHGVLRHLAKLGITSVLVEGGAGVITSFFAAHLVDRLVLVTAPLVIGTGTEAVGDLGTERLSETMRGRTHSVYQADNDIVWEIAFEQG